MAAVETEAETRGGAPLCVVARRKVFAKRAAAVAAANGVVVVEAALAATGEARVRAAVAVEAARQDA